MLYGITVARQAAKVDAPAAELWTPLNMATVPPIYLDAQDSVVTDVGGACSAISNLGAMGSAGDFSQGAAGNRPAILTAELNGNRVLRFDGATSYLLGESAAQKDLYRNTSKLAAFFVYKKRATDASNINRILLHCTIGTSTGNRFSVYAGFPTSGNANKPALASRPLDTDSQRLMNSAIAHSEVYTLLTAYLDLSDETAYIYADGQSAESTSFSSSTGLTSNTASQQPLAIGAFAGGGGAFADIDLAAVVLFNTALTLGERQRLEGWAAHKYGLTANLPVDHPYKTTPPYA